MDHDLIEQRRRELEQRAQRRRAGLAEPVEQKGPGLVQRLLDKAEAHLESSRAAQQDKHPTPAAGPLVHKTYPRLKQLCSLRGFNGERPNLWLVGPVGSGKTSAASQIAKDLGLAFYFNGAIDNEYKLRGFMDAQGRVISTPFRQAFEKGGVYLFDECDASMPSAVLAFNAALANGACDFPDAQVQRHPDCIVLAAANTWGGGATHEYVGRLKQDAAFLDRFLQIEWNYDEAMETALCGNQRWATKIQAIRRAAQELGIRHIVSPRASYWGAVLLAANVPEEEVLRLKVRGSLNDRQWTEILEKACPAP